jgi:hypothetical protein
MQTQTIHTAQSGTVRIYTLTAKSDYSGLARQLKDVHPSKYFTGTNDLGDMTVTVKEF